MLHHRRHLISPPRLPTLHRRRHLISRPQPPRCTAAGTSFRCPGSPSCTSRCWTATGAALRRSGGDPTGSTCSSALCGAWDRTSLHITSSGITFCRSKRRTTVRCARHETRRGATKWGPAARSARQCCAGSPSLQPCRAKSGGAHLGVAPVG
jgi:hypothetical protein